MNVFVDDGFSANDTSRPGWNALLTASSRPAGAGFHVVFAVSADRITRSHNPAHLRRIHYWFAARGIRLFVCR